MGVLHCVSGSTMVSQPKAPTGAITLDIDNIGMI